MTLLDDARRLAAESATYNSGSGSVEECRCSYCLEYVSHDHAPECPWLALPRIVAALEAAERVVRETPRYHHMMGGGENRRCRYCSYRVWSAERPDEYGGGRDHDLDCPWQALVAAMKGDGA